MDDSFFWFPLHSGDFLSKTAHLSATETGCYVLLMVHLCRHERLPGTMAELRRICRGEARQRVEAALRLLEVDGEGYYSKLLREQKGKVAANAAIKSAAGKAGANARWSKQKRMDL